MDTKAKILELIRELGQSKELAIWLLKKIDYLASLGNDIPKVPELEDLTAAAVDIRCKIDKAYSDVIINAPNTNAPKY